MRSILAAVVVMLLVPIGFVRAQALLWEAARDEGAWENAVDVLEATDGGYLTFGNRIHYVGGPGAAVDTSGVLLVKFNRDGVVQWSRRFEENGGARAILPGKDGMYRLVMKSDAQWLLLTIDSMGVILRRDSSASSYDEFFSKAIATRDHGFAVVGFLRRKPVRLGTFIHKYDSNGAIQWSREILGIDGKGVAELAGGGYAVVGATWDTLLGPQDPILVRFNEQGDSLWTRRYPTSSSDGAEAVVEASGGGVVIGCWSSEPQSSRVMVRLIGADAAGNITWDVLHTDSTTYGIPFAGMIGRSDGGYTILGLPRATANVASLLYVDGMGRWQSEFSFAGSDTSSHSLAAIRSTSDGGVVLAGARSNTTTQSDALAMKVNALALGMPNAVIPSMPLRLW